MLTSNARQFVFFENGGYVIHRIALGIGRASAWFDAADRLIDAERFDSRNRSFPLRPNTPAWKAIAVWGPTWASQARRGASASNSL